MYIDFCPALLYNGVDHLSMAINLKICIQGFHISPTSNSVINQYLENSPLHSKNAGEQRTIFTWTLSFPARSSFDERRQGVPGQRGHTQESICINGVTLT